MPLRHRLLAALVAAAWGLNFLAIDASLTQFPPFFLAALRFGCLALPTLLFVPRPQVATRWLVGYGLGFGTFQFLFLYWGMAAGMPPGLASLVLQASAPFTVILGVVLLRTPLSGVALGGVVIAVGGLALVGWQRAAGPATLVPFLLVLAGAFAWAVGNLCAAGAKAPNPLHLTLWMTVVPPLPMLALSLLVEGPAQIEASLTTWDAATPPALFGLAYTVLIGTVVGSGIWSWLMARHPAAVVAPFSMLVPVAGMSAAALLLGERFSFGEVVGAVAIIIGVLIATGGVGWRARKATPDDSRPQPASGAMAR